MMDDLISRAAAIDAIEEMQMPIMRSMFPEEQFVFKGMSEALQAIKDLPSAQPDLSEYSDKLWRSAYERGKAEAEQRWIPCNERLPEKYGKYLVTFIPSGGTFWTCVLVACYSDLMGISKPSFHVGNPGKNDFQNITEQVTAWMPLPEPYRKDGEQNG